MQTIGERLEDARKRKGISLREAAEATKIRSDFLSYIEQNNFDFELPEIYRCGFIKNYARYLKLDPEKVINDYSAQILSKTRNKKGGTEWFGSMDAKSDENGSNGTADVVSINDADLSQNAPSFGSITAKPKEPTQDFDSSSNQISEDTGEKLFYLKVGLILLGALALVFVLFGLVRALISSPAEDITSVVAVQESPAIESSAPNSTTTPTTTIKEFKITASSEVYVAARDLTDRNYLFQGTLSAGEEIVLEKTGPVEVVFTRADQIIISANGQTFHSPESGITGTSKIRLP